MDEIWKFPATYNKPEEGDEGNIVIELEMPKGAEVLSVDCQKGVVCFWAVVNKEAETEKRYFEMVDTGVPFTRIGKKYVGDISIYSGKYIYHMFEIVKEVEQ